MPACHARRDAQRAAGILQAQIRPRRALLRRRSAGPHRHRCGEESSERCRDEKDPLVRRAVVRALGEIRVMTTPRAHRASRRAVTSRSRREPKRTFARSAARSCSRSAARCETCACIRPIIPSCSGRSRSSSSLSAELLDDDGELELRIAGEFLFINQTRLRLDLDNYATVNYLIAQFRASGTGMLRTSTVPTPARLDGVCDVHQLAEGRRSRHSAPPPAPSARGGGREHFRARAAGEGGDGRQRRSAARRRTIPPKARTRSLSRRRRT